MIRRHLAPIPRRVVEHPPLWVALEDRAMRNINRTRVGPSRSFRSSHQARVFGRLLTGSRFLTAQRMEHAFHRRRMEAQLRAWAEQRPPWWMPEALEAFAKAEETHGPKLFC